MQALAGELRRVPEILLMYVRITSYPYRKRSNNTCYFFIALSRAANLRSWMFPNSTTYSATNGKESGLWRSYETCIHEVEQKPLHTKNWTRAIQSDIILTGTIALNTVHLSQQQHVLMLNTYINYFCLFTDQMQSRFD